MDEGSLTIIYYLIPIIVTVFCIFLSIKVSYPKRFLPGILLVVLALVLFFVGQFVSPSNNNNTNFQFGLTFIYMGATFGVGGLITLISVLFRKKS